MKFVMYVNISYFPNNPATELMHIFIDFLNQDPQMSQNNKIFSLVHARYLKYAFTYAKNF